MTTELQRPLLGPDPELSARARKAWDFDVSRPAKGPVRASSTLHPLLQLIEQHTGGSTWRSVLRDIAAENAKRRASYRDDAEVYWTWEQWDRFIAAVEQTHVNADDSNSFVNAFHQLRRRIKIAKSDGLSAWNFHLALRRISEHEDAIAARQRAQTERSERMAEDSAYRVLLADALRKERARAEARRIVQAENGGPKRRRPPPTTQES